VRSEDRTPEAIRTALDDLLQHEGWAILQELVEAKYGYEALFQRLDARLAGTKASDKEEQDAAYAIHFAARKAAYDVLALPHSKLQAVQEQKPPALTYDKYRRGPRRA
jgi:hypothetical protein